MADMRMAEGDPTVTLYVLIAMVAVIAAFWIWPKTDEGGGPNDLQESDLDQRTVDWAKRRADGME